MAEMSDWTTTRRPLRRETDWRGRSARRTRKGANMSNPSQAMSEEMEIMTRTKSRTFQPERRYAPL